MANIAVITDPTAQFPNPSFAGKDLIRVIPFDILLDGVVYKEGHDVKSGDFPASLKSSSDPKLIVPSAAEIAELFTALLRKFNELLVIVNSAELTPLYQNALDAVKIIQGGTAIQVINSMTISSGLGILVQTAAELISSGADMSEVEKQIRQMIPHIYTLVCSPSLRYLHNSNLVDYQQAVVGEYLNLHPIFSFEEGRPNAFYKVRNFRHAQDFFQEFIEEFDELTHISLLKGINTQGIDNRLLRQFVQEIFPDTPFSEHRLNSFLATLFGPRSLGLIVIEEPYTLSG
jgi:DegV family protein with EDD domain